MSTTPTITTSYGATPQVVLRYPDAKDPKWSAFNPSISKAPDGTLGMLIRSSNYYIEPDTGITSVLSGGTIKTRTWYCIVDPNDLSLHDLREISFSYPSNMIMTRGVEDARLFWRDDSWYFTAVMFEPPAIKYARLCLFKLDTETNVATFVKLYPGPKEDRSEKNWMAPDVATAKFDYIYSNTQTYKDDEVHGTYTDMEISIDKSKYLSSLRGGSCLVLQEDGTYLAVVHDVEVRIKREYDPRSFGFHNIHHRNYQHYFARYSSDGELIALSPAFLFKTPGIEYGSGMVEIGTDLIVSFGAKDVFCCLIKLDKKRVVDSLQPIGG